jgi:predicted ATPase/DNA-binding SARP family transcriptional activator
MEFGVLGPLQVLQEGQTVRITGPRERALLAALLLRPGEVVSADRLIDLLWGDEVPGNAPNALQAVVTRLRKALGPHGKDLLVTRTPGYALAVSHDQVDVHRFQGLLDQAGRLLDSDPATASVLLEQAFGLWRGPALQDLADQPLAQHEIGRLEELRLAALETRIEAELALGRHGEVIGDLQSLVAVHPLRERLRGLLMLALYRAGRQADALGVYQQTRAVLGEELGLDPEPAIQALHQQILRQDPSLAAPIQTRREPGHALPARISSFIGRMAELEDLRRLLARSRLLTVIGPGGSGKTSLAVEVARTAAFASHEGKDAVVGVRFVDLAPVVDPTQVATAVAAALGLRSGPGGAAGTPTPPEVQLEDFVRATQPLLLLLDNCEHLIEAVAHLTERLLRAAAGARVLATSREPLGLTGEVAWSIPGLAVPDPSLPVDQLRGFDAVRLFTERATAARPGFCLDEQTGPLVAEICRRLDGLPLAIELAAARTRTLPVQEIATRLDDRFRLLTSGARTAVRRQQTLRGAIDWSYELLTEPERLLLARLSVFAASWSLEAAEAVCGDDQVPAGQILELVSRLVDRSLLQPEPGPAARFRLLETIQAYATERLQERGEAAGFRRRHVEHFLRVAETAGAHPESAGWLQALEAAIDDLRAALDWALTTGAHEILLRFAGALGWYWATWHDQEGIHWMNAILSAVQPEASPAFGRALLASAFVESYAPSQASKRRAMKSVELLERFGDRSGAGRARLILAFIELMLGGEPTFAERHIHTADQAFAEVHDRWGQAFAALSRFRLHLHTGSLQRSITAGHDALERFRALGDPWGIPWTTLWLGTATRMAGDLQQARRLFEEAIAAADHLAYVRCTAHAELGCLAALQGAHQRAGEHQQAAADLASTTGVRDSVAMAANATGLIARFQGDASEAKANHLQALAVFQELGSEIGLAYTRCCLGYADHQLGHANTAARHFGDAIILAHKSGRPDIMAAALEGLACAAAVQDAGTCARLLGAAQRIRETTGIQLTMIEGHDPQQAQAHARSVLGTKQFLAATNTGEHLSLDEMLALGVAQGRSSQASENLSEGASPQEGSTEPAGS